MGDWLLNLPVPWMALVIFLATYLIAGGVYLIVTKLAVNERAKAFKAVSPGMLSPLGILFALLVGFIAVEVWSNFDKAKAAVAAEASALRAVVREHADRHGGRRDRQPALFRGPPVFRPARKCAGPRAPRPGRA